MRLDRATTPPESERARGFEVAALDRYLPDLPQWEHWEVGGQNLAIAAGATAQLIQVQFGIGPAVWVHGVAFLSDDPWFMQFTLRVNGGPVLSQIAVPISASLADLRVINLKVSARPATINVFATNTAGVARQAQARVSGYCIGPPTRGA